ncbi:MAG: type II/IV secretion system protein, partial [Selenomonadaceae bacterium]|nr:type II/IV secretion system protein [Selenomonadaceae bacterium]
VCRESYEVQAGSEETALLGRHYHPGLRLYRGRGCPECHGTGLRGRMAIHEILEMKAVLRTRLRRSKEPDALRRAAEEAGLVSMQQDGVQKVLQGLTTIGEVRRALYGGD